MNKEDLELIQDEFIKQKENNMQKTVITKGLIEKLFNEYNRCCYTELYYDRDDLTDIGRKRFNNWCDPVEEGIWDFTIEQVRENSKRTLRELKKYTYKDHRFYIDYKQDKVDLYFYGRDIDDYQMDYWFSFWNE